MILVRRRIARYIRVVSRLGQMLSNLPTNLRFRTFVDRVPWKLRTLIMHAAPESVKCPIIRGFRAPTQKLAATAVGTH